MKQLISLFAVLVSLNAVASGSEQRASSYSFTYFGSHLGGYTMVSCDYAEQQVTDLFRLFGATDVETSCSGGIMPNGMLMPLSLRVKYLPVTVSESMKTVRETFEDRDFYGNACDFNSRLVRDAVRKFKNVKMRRASDACMGGSQNWTFEFDVQLPQ